MNGKRAFTLSIIAGIFAGIIAVAINFTVVQARQNDIANFYADEFVAPGIIDEEAFNHKLQQLQVQNLVLPIAIGVGGGAVIALVYRKVGRGAFKVALGVAGAAWLALCIMPAIKYPANPDTAFNTEGDGGYSMINAGYTAASVAAALGSAFVFSKVGRNNWYIGGAGLYIGLVGGLYFLFPSFFGLEFVPKQLLAEWRSSMTASMTALWFSLGIISGALLEREEKKEKGVTKVG